MDPSVGATINEQVLLIYEPIHLLFTKKNPFWHYVIFIVLEGESYVHLNA